MKASDIGPPEPISGINLPPLHEKWLRHEGRVLFREARVPIHSDYVFRLSWAKRKRDWLSRGYSLRNVNGAWILEQWLHEKNGEYSLTEKGKAILANVAPTQATMEFREPIRQLPGLRADIEAKLRNYQLDPARQLYRAVSNGRAEWGYSGAVDLSDMGTGKTYMALAAALQTGRRVGVLCPPVGQPGWQRGFAHFGAEPAFLSTYEAVRGNWRQNIVQELPDGRFEWKSPRELVLILDEAQALRHDDTLTARCCLHAIRQGIPMIIASATIALSPLEMRFAGRITGLHQGGDDWHRFLSDHGCLKTGKTWAWDRKIHHLQRIHSKLFPLRGCRVRKQDLGDDCPDTIIELLRLEVENSDELQRKWLEYEQFIERMERQKTPKFELLKLQQKASNEAWFETEKALVPCVAALAKQEMQEGRAVVVFMNFNATRMMMGDLLGSHDGFYGGQNPRARKAIEEAFQANRIWSLVSNIKAGGASVSLHDVTGERPRTAFIFPTFQTIAVQQATGRVDRVGGKTVSRQYIVTVEGTVTQRIVRSLRSRLRALDFLNDGQSSESRF